MTVESLIEKLDCDQYIKFVGRDIRTVAFQANRARLYSELLGCNIEGIEPVRMTIVSKLEEREEIVIYVYIEEGL